MEWAQILVIILSVFLAIFLLLAIILIVLLIKVTNQIKSVTGTAAKTADGVEKIIANLSTASSPMVILQLIKRAMNKSKK